MTAPRFLQIHTLQSYPAVLLNRDDSGLAKRLPFGGATRTRVSSQCLKRHWRKAEDEYALETIGVPMGVRSRRIIERGIMQPLLDDGADRSVVEAIAEVFMKQLSPRQFDGTPECGSGLTKDAGEADGLQRAYGAPRVG